MILKGLPKEYAPFNSTIRTKDDALTFEKHSVLLQPEEQSINKGSEANSALAMFVSGGNKPNNGNPSFNINSSFNRGRGRNLFSRGRGGGGRSNTYSFNPLSQNQFLQ